MTSGPARLPLSALLIAPLCGFVMFLFLTARLFPTGVPSPCVEPNLLRDWWWGGLQLWAFPLAYQVLAPLVPIIVLLLPARVFEEASAKTSGLFRRLYNTLRHPALLFGAGALLLWFCRSATLGFGDSEFYTTDLIPSQAFSERGVFVGYDSVGASLLNSLGYRYAHLALAVNALEWYQVFGIACLLGFFAWIYSTRHRGRHLAGGAAMLLLFSANWSQTTFGAAEHYGQVMLAMAAFAILAVEALNGREPLWKPCLAYAIGAFFHLLIAWLLPALLFLVVACWRRESRDGRALALCALLLPAFLTGSLCYFLGFDLSFLSSSNAAEGKLIPFLSPMDPYSGGPNYHYATLDPRHLTHIAMENLLMGWPGILLLAAGIPHLSYRYLYKDRAGAFLLVLLGSALLFSLLWNPDLEMWKDQDLFSMPGLMWCLLAAYALLGPAGARTDPDVRRRLLAAAVLGGLAWRLPVILFHGPLDPNYVTPSLLRAVCPFSGF